MMQTLRLLTVAAAGWLGILAVSAQTQEKVTISSSHLNVLNPCFMGIGFRATAHLGECSRQDLDDVLIKRWREARPPYAVLPCSPNWDWDAVVPRIKEIYAGSELWVTPMAGGSKGPNIDEITTMLERLVKKEGVEGITRYIINPPGYEDVLASTDPAELANFTSKLDAQLKAAGLAIHVDPSLPGATVAVPPVGTQDEESTVSLDLAQQIMEAANSGQTCVTILDWNPPSPGTFEGSGLFSWDAPDFLPRPAYYAVALLSKLSWPRSAVYGNAFELPGAETTNSIDNLHVACLRKEGTDPFTDRTTDALLILNRTASACTARWQPDYGGGSKGMCKMNQYLFLPGEQPLNRAADLPAVMDLNFYFDATVPTNALYVVSSILTKHIGMRDGNQPDRPQKIYSPTVSDVDGGKSIEWEHIPNAESCYYRVYRMNLPKYSFAKKEHIGSTVANHFVDTAAPAGARSYYAVIAVDRDGVTSE